MGDADRIDRTGPSEGFTILVWALGILTTWFALTTSSMDNLHAALLISVNVEILIAILLSNRVIPRFSSITALMAVPILATLAVLRACDWVQRYQTFELVPLLAAVPGMTLFSLLLVAVHLHLYLKNAPFLAKAIVAGVAFPLCVWSMTMIARTATLEVPMRSFKDPINGVAVRTLRARSAPSLIIGLAALPILRRRFEGQKPLSG